MQFDVILYGLADATAAAQLEMSVQSIKGIEYCLVNHNVSRMTIRCADEAIEVLQPQILAAINQSCPGIEPKM